MKTLLTFALLFAASVQAYEAYPMQNYFKEQEREFNDRWNRVEQRMQAQESNRIQREMLQEVQRQNSSGVYRYGR